MQGALTMFQGEAEIVSAPILPKMELCVLWPPRFRV